MTEKTKLTALDWIKGGFRSLASDGPQGLKAEVLARKLKVSKGSFYWHFKDVAALKTAMLDHWEELATQQIIAQVDAGSPDPKQRLYDLIEIAASEVSEEYGANGVSNALRNWAQFDELARAYTTKIDRRRLEYVESLFSQVPQTRKHAKINAQILYATLIGAEQLDQADTKACLAQTLDIMMGSERPIPA
ncbi:transcriptional regulator, TetR family [Pseudovibrio denitrificans]|uniref:Transcriptional regulator, TetR family n=1 Tax=Pseudovibrio denitrificans TaxID=258256 RepID=A0A1I6Z8N8_9HYPH|nr:TetR/AcrR family transcriptional regulator [Pseudovibrio denitrificans]SFT59065.1 transcriptional regulator, TetR family [Pseudovibrio denitrificans]